MQHTYASLSHVRLPSLGLPQNALPRRGGHMNCYLVARSVGIGVLVCSVLALLENATRVSVPRAHGRSEELGALVHTHAARAMVLDKVPEDSHLVDLVREVTRTVEHIKHVTVTMATTVTHTVTHTAPDTPLQPKARPQQRLNSEGLGKGSRQSLVHSVLGESGPVWGRGVIRADVKKIDEVETHVGVHVEELGSRDDVPPFGHVRSLVRSPGAHERDSVRYAIQRATQAAKDQKLNLCSEDMFAHKLVEEFDASRVEFCSPGANRKTNLNPETNEGLLLNAATTQTRSLIHRWSKQHPNSRHPWSIWLAHNVSLNGRGDNLSMVADCNPIGAFAPDDPVSDWSVHAATSTLLAKTVARDGALAGTCSQWRNDTLLLVDSYDWNNMFHFFEEFSAMFAAMATLEGQMNGHVQVAFLRRGAGNTDIRPLPLTEIYSMLLSQNSRPPVGLWGDPIPTGTCFRTVAFYTIPHALLSPNLNGGIGHPQPCFSPIWRAMGDYLRAGMQVPTYDKTWNPRVIFAARSLEQAGTTPWQRTRLLLNQEKVVDWLNATCQSQGMEFSTLRYYGDGRFVSVRQQAHAVGRGDILIGVHGAGLALQLFMPRDSLIFEIHVKSRGNHHFDNMANYLGHSYHTISSDNYAEKNWVEEGLLKAVKTWRQRQQQRKTITSPYQ